VHTTACGGGRRGEEWAISSTALSGVGVWRGRRGERAIRASPYAAVMRRGVQEGDRLHESAVHMTLRIGRRRQPWALARAPGTDGGERERAAKVRAQLRRGRAYEGGAVPTRARCTRCRAAGDAAARSGRCRQPRALARASTLDGREPEQTYRRSEPGRSQNRAPACSFPGGDAEGCDEPALWRRRLLGALAEDTALAESGAIR